MRAPSSNPVTTTVRPTGSNRRTQHGTAAEAAIVHVADDEDRLGWDYEHWTVPVLAPPDMVLRPAAGEDPTLERMAMKGAGVEPSPGARQREPCPGRERPVACAPAPPPASAGPEPVATVVSAVKAAARTNLRIVALPDSPPLGPRLRSAARHPSYGNPAAFRGDLPSPSLQRQVRTFLTARAHDSRAARFPTFHRSGNNRLEPAASGQRGQRYEVFAK